jgi:excisionase family DNA binding protein
MVDTKADPIPTWSRETIEALGPTTTVQMAASVLGICAWTVYDLIRRGQWDATRVLRLGRKIKIPTNDLITLLYPPATIPGR